jgi:hypothetical protein
MRYTATLFTLLFAAFAAGAQTYTPTANGKVIITVTQNLPDGGVVTTETAPIDSAEAAARFLNSLVSTNQRIAEIKTETELLEAQALRTALAYESLKGESTDTRVGSIFAPQIVGDYKMEADGKQYTANIRKKEEGYIIETEFGAFKLVIRSGALFEVYDIFEEKYPLKFTQRQEGSFAHDERGRKIVLNKVKEREAALVTIETNKAVKKEAQPEPTKHAKNTKQKKQKKQ